MKQVEKNSNWYLVNCKLELDKSQCSRLINSEIEECEYCLNHLPNSSPKVFAFQCTSCGYRVVTGNHKTQDSSCEKCKIGLMKSKDLENVLFQEKERR